MKPKKTRAYIGIRVKPVMEALSSNAYPNYPNKHQFDSPQDIKQSLDSSNKSLVKEFSEGVCKETSQSEHNPADIQSRIRKLNKMISLANREQQASNSLVYENSIKEMQKELDSLKNPQPTGDDPSMLSKASIRQQSTNVVGEEGSCKPETGADNTQICKCGHNLRSHSGIEDGVWKSGRCLLWKCKCENYSPLSKGSRAREKSNKPTPDAFKEINGEKLISVAPADNPERQEEVISGKDSLNETSILSRGKLKEIEDRLYSLNAQISLKWIGMRQTPKDTEITLLNRALGEIIKQIREIRENER